MYGCVFLCACMCAYLFMWEILLHIWHGVHVERGEDNVCCLFSLSTLWDKISYLWLPSPHRSTVITSMCYCDWLYVYSGYLKYSSQFLQQQVLLTNDTSFQLLILCSSWSYFLYLKDLFFLQLILIPVVLSAALDFSFCNIFNNNLFWFS